MQIESAEIYSMSQRPLNTAALFYGYSKGKATTFSDGIFKHTVWTQR